MTQKIKYFHPTIKSGLLLTAFFTTMQITLAQISNHFGTDFSIIKYNNADANPYLGVGLWAWPLPMDFDEDGDLDLLVSCPDVPYNGLYLFENKQGDKPATLMAPVRVAYGDKNFQVSFKGNEPLVTKGAVMFDDFRNSLLERQRQIFAADSLEQQHQKIRFKQWKFLDYEGDGDMDLVAGMDDWVDYGWDNAYDSEGNWTNGPQHGFIYLIENKKGTLRLSGKIKAGGKAIDVYGAPSPNLADFDNDGDLDIICGEFMDKLTWFKNRGSRKKPIYETGKYLRNQNGEIALDLQMIIPVAIDWDRDADVDLIVGDEDGRVAFVENTGEIDQGMPLFKDPVYLRQQPDNLKFGALVTPISTDWDNDGDEDLICGNTAGYIGFIENLDGNFPPKWAEPKYLQAHGEDIRILAGANGSIQGPCEAKWGYTTLSVADWDADGLQDVIANSIWGKIIWFKNIGSRGNPKLDTARLVQVTWNEGIPKPHWNWWNPGASELATQWRTTPCAIDWNQDGLTDLIMLDHEGFLSYFERFKQSEQLWLRPGRRIFYGTNYSGYNSKHQVTDSTAGVLQLNTGINGGSGRRKFCFMDWDQDGDLDLMVNSVNTTFLENISEVDGKYYFTDRGPLSNLRLAGHTTSPTAVDWNKDGIPDLLTGAEDGHFYYLNNPYSSKPED